MDDLVEGALEKGRVDGADGMQVFRRQARCKSNRVLLRDSNVKETVGKAFAKQIEAGSCNLKNV